MDEGRTEDPRSVSEGRLGHYTQRRTTDRGRNGEETLKMNLLLEIYIKEQVLVKRKDYDLIFRTHTVVLLRTGRKGFLRLYGDLYEGLATFAHLREGGRVGGVSPPKRRRFVQRLVNDWVGVRGINKDVFKSYLLLDDN